MSRLPRLSGKEIVKIIIESFGFRVTRQRGSHIVLTRVDNGRKRVTVVPLHDDVKAGTLLGILNLAGIEREEFIARAKGKKG